MTLAVSSTRGFHFDRLPWGHDHDLGVRNPVQADCSTHGLSPDLPELERGAVLVEPRAVREPPGVPNQVVLALPRAPVHLGFLQVPGERMGALSHGARVPEDPHLFAIVRRPVVRYVDSSPRCVLDDVEPPALAQVLDMVRCLLPVGSGELDGVGGLDRGSGPPLLDEIIYQLLGPSPVIAGPRRNQGNTEHEGSVQEREPHHLHTFHSQLHGRPTP